MERELRLGKNISILRQIYGESQEELANRIADVSEIDSGHSRIANYEQGIRTPNLEMIEIIAKHYNVTVETLMFAPLEKTYCAEFFSRLLHNVGRSESIIFPYENVDMDGDSDFMIGLETHRKMYQTEFKHGDRLMENYNRALDAYLTSIERQNNNAAIVNSLALIISTYNELSSIEERQPDLVFPSDGEWTRRIAKMATRFLIGDSTTRQNIQEKKGEFANIIHSNCFTLMRILKMEGYKWECYADYYWALLYIMNFNKHPSSPPEQTGVGFHMLMDLCELKNPHAQKAMELFYPDWNK